MIDLSQLGSDTVCASHGRGLVPTDELHYSDEHFCFISMEHDPIPLAISFATAVRLLDRWGGVLSLVEDLEPGTPAAVGVMILRSGLGVLAEINRKP
jgi:hypothetical protein